MWANSFLPRPLIYILSLFPFNHGYLSDLDGKNRNEETGRQAGVNLLFLGWFRRANGV